MTINRLDLRERIAVCRDFTPEESAFILNAVNMVPASFQMVKQPNDDPVNTIPRIEAMWAYLSVDKTGNEGVCAAPLARGVTAALCAADERRLRELRPTVALMARMWGRPIRLVKFLNRLDIDVVTPDGTPAH
jgi:hypothetical protein